MRTVREGLLKANSIWSERAWVLVGALLFAGTVTCWLYGDRHEHYNGFLVLLGWTCLAIGVCVYRIRPSAPRMAAWLSAHKGAIVLSFIALALLYAYAGDILIYLAPSTSWGYALKYDVAESKVAIEKQPHDCA